MTLNIDIAPTLLQIAGLPPAARIQGRNLVPIMANPKVAWRGEFFYEHTYSTDPPRLPIPPSEAIRTSQWKYFRYTTQKPVYEQLFDLRADPEERQNQVRIPTTKRRWIACGPAGPPSALLPLRAPAQSLADGRRPAARSASGARSACSSRCARSIGVPPPVSPAG